MYRYARQVGLSLLHCKLRNIVGIWSRFDVVVPTYMFDNVSWAYPFVINMMIDKGDSQ